MPKAKYKKRKDGRYCTKIDTGRDPQTGKRRYQMIYAKTIAELEKKRAEIITSLNKGLYISPTVNETFGTYKKKWLQQKAICIELNTLQMYKNASKYLSALDDLLLREITRSNIQDIINQNVSHPRTCQQIKITAQQIMESAIEDGLLYKNPCRKLIIPKYKAKEKRPLTPQEDLLSDVSDFSNRETAFIKIIKYAGLRKGETLALYKKDIDFKKGVIIVSKSLAFEKNIPYLKEPKSEAGYREVPMPKELIIYLKQYTSNLADDLLFQNIKNGGLVTRQGYKKMWESIIKKMNKKSVEMNLDYYVENLTAHIFRHNYATTLYYAGVQLKEAQYLMGHSTIQVLLDIYTHLEENNEAVTQKLNNYYDNKQKKQLSKI